MSGGLDALAITVSTSPIILTPCENIFYKLKDLRLCEFVNSPSYYDVNQTQLTLTQCDVNTFI